MSTYDEVLKCVNSKTPSDWMTERFHTTALRVGLFVLWNCAAGSWGQGLHSPLAYSSWERLRSGKELLQHGLMKGTQGQFTHESLKPLLMCFAFEQAGRKTNLHKDEQSILKKEMWKSDGEGNIFPNNEFENQKDSFSCWLGNSHFSIFLESF